jgi:ketosteroid isomerase-like protein
VSEENRKIVSGIYEIAKTGDFARLKDLMATDYVLVQSPGHPMPGSSTGAAASAAAGRLAQALGTTDITVHEIITDGPHRVMSIVELTGIDGKGQPWTMPLVECIWVDHGKVTEVRPFYWDQIELARIVASRSA